MAAAGLGVGRGTITEANTHASATKLRTGIAMVGPRSRTGVKQRPRARTVMTVRTNRARTACRTHLRIWVLVCARTGSCPSTRARTVTMLVTRARTVCARARTGTSLITVRARVHPCAHG